jgi:flagella basal body P-ring formation protein FlgA
MVLMAGAKVTLIEQDVAVRIETQGVAQGSGAVGDRVKVRLVTLSAEGGERFVDGIVRASDVVEMVAR